MKLKWKEDAGAGSFSIHGPGIDFAAKFDPEALYDVPPETAGRLLKSGLFEEAAETTRRARKAAQREENNETDVSEDKENE